jgi:hypothetical protein
MIVESSSFEKPTEAKSDLKQMDVVHVRPPHSQPLRIPSFR